MTGPNDSVDSTTAPPTPDPLPRVDRPLRSRYALVALLVLGALLAFATDAFITSAAIDATAKTFNRSSVPGTITTSLHPGTWNVWLEGPGTVDDVLVTDSSGRAIEVRMQNGGTSYTRDGFTATRVASFEIPRGGMSTGVRIEVIGRAEFPEVAFAVGPADEFRYVDVARYGTIAVIAIDLLAIALIIAVPIIRYRRRS